MIFHPNFVILQIFSQHSADHCKQLLFAFFFSQLNDNFIQHPFPFINVLVMMSINQTCLFYNIQQESNIPGIMFLRSAQPNQPLPPPTNQSSSQNLSQNPIKYDQPKTTNQPITIRDIMRMHNLQVERQNSNSNSILPPALTNPYYSSNDQVQSTNNQPIFNNQYQRQQKQPIMPIQRMQSQPQPQFQSQTQSQPQPQPQIQLQNQSGSFYETNHIMRNVLERNVIGPPICPPQHIQSQSQSSIDHTFQPSPPQQFEAKPMQQTQHSFSNLQQQRFQAQPEQRSRTPRRRKIFQTSIKPQPPPQTNPNVQTRNYPSFGNTPQSPHFPQKQQNPIPFGGSPSQFQNNEQFSPSNPVFSQPSSPPSFSAQGRPSKANISNQSINRSNSLSSAYHTVPSIQKSGQKRGNDNEHIQQGSGFGEANFILEPSGISLKSLKSKEQSKKQIIAASQPTPINPNPFTKLSRTGSQSPPVPVYQSKFYKKPSPNPFNQISGSLLNMQHPLNNNDIKNNVGNTYEPYYSNLIADANRKQLGRDYPNQNQYQNYTRQFGDAMMQDFTNYQKNRGSNYQINVPGSYDNHINSPSFAYNFNNSADNSILNSTKPVILLPSPPPHQQPQQPQSLPTYMPVSPFQQTQQQQLLQMPKKFQIIQQKVQKQSSQIAQLSQKLAQNQITQLQTQKQLLQELIKKQKELKNKQSLLNEHQSQINRLNAETHIKKQQILKYQLELEQARRMQKIYRENQRLVEIIVGRGNGRIDGVGVGGRYKGEVWEEFGRSDGKIGVVLSPFSMTPTRD